MGVKQFLHWIEDTDAVSAFQKLQAEKLLSHGNNKYAGTIAQSELASEQPVHSFPRYLKYNDSKAVATVMELNHGEEVGKCYFIDLGVVRYKVSRLTRTVKPYTAVYRQRYAVTDLDGNILQPESANLFEQKGPADEKAAKLALDGTPVKVRRLMAILSGEDTVTEFNLEEFYRKKEPKIQKRSFEKIEESHLFLFFGRVPT